MKTVVLIAVLFASNTALAKPEKKGSEIYTNCRISQYKLICMV